MTMLEKSPKAAASPSQPRDRQTDWNANAPDYDRLFGIRIEESKLEGRYRIFADIKRRSGEFPMATHVTTDGSRTIAIWCSNDYLGMGQHPSVRAAMHEAIDAVGAGSGGTRNNGPSPQTPRCLMLSQDRVCKSNIPCVDRRVADDRGARDSTSRMAGAA